MKLPTVRFIPAAVLTLGLATTVTLYGIVSYTVEQRRKDTFNAEVKRVREKIGDALRRQVSFLHATAGLIAADPKIANDKFSVFGTNLVQDIGDPLPFEMGLTTSRPWDRRGELVAAAALRGVSPFVPAGGPERESVDALLLVKMLVPSKAAPKFGLDMSLDPVRGAAIRQARRSRSASMTTLIRHSNAGEKIAPAVLFFLPVNPTAKEQPEDLVYSAIDVNQLFRDLFPKPNPSIDPERDPSQHFGLRISAVDANRTSLIFERSLDEPVRRPFSEDLTLDEVGMRVLIEYNAGTKFDTAAVIGPYILPVGSVLSILLFLLAASLRRSQETAQRHADEQRLIAEVGRHTGDGGEDDEFLTEVAHSVAKVFDVICRFDLPRPDGSLHWVSTRQANADVLAEIEEDRPRLEKDQNLIAALETGLTQRFEGYTPADETHRKRLDKLNIGPVAIVPMRARGRSVGAITLTRPRGAEPLSHGEVALLESIAGRMALTIDNARLYEAAQKEIVVRRAAEGEVRRLNESLEEIVSERTRDLEASNRELESFCYSVSHDLRTPLRSLDGFGRALKEDYGDRLDEQGLDFIDRIRNSARRMDELITALLTLSRLTRREIMPVVINATQAITDLAHDLSPDGKIAFEIQSGMEAKADPRMFNVVFENLLSNAVKFSARAENPKIIVSQAEDGTIAVKDNGAGFDPRYSNKLFQPFERLHSAREFPGHGIGLATVERIVRRHGGTVLAESRPGEGATFFVRFP